MCKTNNTWKYDIRHFAEIPRQYKADSTISQWAWPRAVNWTWTGTVWGHASAGAEWARRRRRDRLGGRVQRRTGLHEPAGACCQTNGTCTETDRATCEAIAQARFAGEGTSCATTPCCPDPFADTDGDGDVDQADFAVLQNCYTGPLEPPGPSCRPNASVSTGPTCSTMTSIRTTGPPSRPVPAARAYPSTRPATTRPDGGGAPTARPVQDRTVGAGVANCARTVTLPSVARRRDTGVCGEKTSRISQGSRRLLLGLAAWLGGTSVCPCCGQPACPVAPAERPCWRVWVPWSPSCFGEADLQNAPGPMR